MNSKMKLLSSVSLFIGVGICIYILTPWSYNSHVEDSKVEIERPPEPVTSHAADRNRTLPDSPRSILPTVEADSKLQETDSDEALKGKVVFRSSASFASDCKFRVARLGSRMPNGWWKSNATDRENSSQVEATDESKELVIKELENGSYYWEFHSETFVLARQQSQWIGTRFEISKDQPTAIVEVMPAEIYSVAINRDSGVRAMDMRSFTCAGKPLRSARIRAVERRRLAASYKKLFPSANLHVGAFFPDPSDQVYISFDAYIRGKGWVILTAPMTRGPRPVAPQYVGSLELQVASKVTGYIKATHSGWKFPDSKVLFRVRRKGQNRRGLRRAFSAANGEENVVETGDYLVTAVVLGVAAQSVEVSVGAESHVLANTDLSEWRVVTLMGLEPDKVYAVLRTVSGNRQRTTIRGKTQIQFLCPSGPHSILVSMAESTPLNLSIMRGEYVKNLPKFK